MIKKFNYLLIALLISIPVFADEVTKTLVFEWDPPTQAEVSGWYLWISSSESDGYQKVADTNGNVIKILRSELVNGFYQATQAFIVSGPANSIQRKWFRLTAFGVFDSGELESDFSNTVYFDFKIPITMEVPVFIKVYEK